MTVEELIYQLSQIEDKTSQVYAEASGEEDETTFNIKSVIIDEVKDVVLRYY